MGFETNNSLHPESSAIGNNVGTRLQAFGHFLRRHWAATTAFILALLLTGVVVGLIIAFPYSLFAIAFVPILSTTPLAFLANLTFPAAVAVVAAFTFLANIYISAAFNALVIIHNLLDEWISPSAAGSNKPVLRFRTTESETNQETIQPTWLYDGNRVRRYASNLANTDIPKEEDESMEIESSSKSNEETSFSEDPAAPGVPPQPAVIPPSIPITSPQTHEDQDPSMGYGKPFHSLTQNVNEPRSKSPSLSTVAITVSAPSGGITTAYRRSASSTGKAHSDKSAVTLEVPELIAAQHLPR
jgi:hypothetical protein